MGFVANYVRNLAPLALGRQPQRPLLFSYYITHRCGLDCRYCCDGFGTRFHDMPVPELSTAEARRLLSVLRRSTDCLDITGGEPLLRPDLEDVLAHAREIGFRTVLNTKGLGLSGRPDVLRLADVLVFGVDSLDAGRLAGMIGRPRAVAEQILAALDFALQNRTGRTKVVLSVVATPVNLGDIRELLRFALDRGLGFQISPEILGTEPNPELKSNPLYEEAIDEVLRAKRRHRGVFGVPTLVLRDELFWGLDATQMAADYAAAGCRWTDPEYARAATLPVGASRDAAKVRKRS